MLTRNFYCSDAVVNDLNTLHPVTVYLFSLEHDDFLHKLPNDFGIQFLDVRVLLHQLQEVFGIEGFFFCCGNELIQFSNPAFQGFLLCVIGSGHLGKPLIADFSNHIVLVKSLDDFIKGGDAGFRLFVFLLTAAEFSVQCLFRCVGHKLNELGFMFSGIMRGACSESNPVFATSLTVIILGCFISIFLPPFNA